MDKPSEHNDDLNSKFEHYEHQPSSNVWDHIQKELNDDNDASLAVVFSNYTHQPGNHVWAAIATEIQPKRKRRAIYWWSAVAAGITLLTGLFFYQQFNNFSEKRTAVAAAKTGAEKSTQPKEEKIPVLNIIKDDYKNIAETENHIATVIDTLTAVSNQYSKQNTVAKSNQKNTIQLHKSVKPPVVAHVDYASKINAKAIAHDTLVAVVISISEIPFENDFVPLYEPSKFALTANVAPYYRSTNGYNENLDASLANNAFYDGSPPANHLEANVNSNVEHHFPLTMGAGVNFKLNKRWSLGTGLDYVRMQRKTVFSDSNWETEQTNVMNYLGIPLFVNFKIIKGRKFDLFITAGAKYEKGIRERVKYTESENGEEVNSYHFSQNLEGGQAGANLGFGSNYHITKHFDAYLIADVVQYFYQSHYNIWSEKTLWPGLKMGIRYNFLKE